MGLGSSIWIWVGFQDDGRSWVTGRGSRSGFCTRVNVGFLDEGQGLVFRIGVGVGVVVRVMFREESQGKVEFWDRSGSCFTTGVRVGSGSWVRECFKLCIQIKYVIR